MKKLFLPILILFVFNTLLIAQLKVKDQDATPHTLMQVNDEGIAGSITLGQLTTIGAPASKLYNLGGVLHWAGSPLATGGSSPWTINGSNIYYNTGNVGIGLTTPLDKLHLLGDFRIDDASPYLNFYAGSTLMGHIGFWTDNNLNIINKSATSNIVLGTNSTEKVRITSSGNIGVGTTNPLSKLSVDSDGEATVTIASENSIENGTAIYGVSYATPSTGVNGSVLGGNYSAGVDGSASLEGDVLTFGGRFSAIGNQSRGVYGSANSSTGKNYGVYGVTNSASGYGGYFEGRGYFSGNVGIGTDNPNSKLSIVGLSEYSDNAAALSAGLVAGDLYRTGDLLKIVH